jgi:hypothetical protein
MALGIVARERRMSRKESNHSLSKVRDEYLKASPLVPRVTPSTMENGEGSRIARVEGPSTTGAGDKGVRGSEPGGAARLIRGFSTRKYGTVEDKPSAMDILRRFEGSG